MPELDGNFQQLTEGLGYTKILKIGKGSLHSECWEDVSQSS